jgi:hypothetical protein
MTSPGRPITHRPRILLAFSIFLVLSGLSFANETAASFEWRKKPNTTFKVGESILYVIKYGFVPSGFATLEIPAIENVDGRPAYHIVSRAKTNKATDLIFKVRDKNESWMDVESLCSLRFHQNLKEGLHRRETRTDYDHSKGKFKFWKKRKGKEYTEEGGMPPYVQDVLSSMYFIRSQALEVGKDYSFDANSGGKTWPMKVHVEKIQTVKVPAGRFECLVVEPILAGEGIFQQEGRLEVWLTNDARKIPVLMRSRVMVGSFDAEMKEYKADQGLENGVGEKDLEEAGE